MAMNQRTGVLVYDNWPLRPVIVEAETARFYRVRGRGADIRQPIGRTGVRITLRSGTAHVEKRRFRADPRP